jgi:hypothetical protein
MTVIGPYRPDLLSPLHIDKATVLRTHTGLSTEEGPWAVECSSPSRKGVPYLLGYARTAKAARAAAEQLADIHLRPIEVFSAVKTAERRESWAPVPPNAGERRWRPYRHL